MSEVDATTPDAFDAVGEPPPESVSTSAIRDLQTGSLSASMSAIASAQAGSLDATASAVGMARVDGDAEARLSWVGLMTSKGAATMHQSYSSAFVAADELNMSQSASAMTVARTVSFEQSGALVSLSGNAEVKRGFIGVLLAPKADISEDTRILIGGKGLLVLALAVLGGFGLVAIAMIYGAERVSSWRPNIELPKLPEWARRG